MEVSTLKKGVNGLMEVLPNYVWGHGVYESMQTIKKNYLICKK